MSRPTTYTDEIADEIVDGLWEGKTLTQLQREGLSINRRTISDWRKSHSDFDERYRTAMAGGAEALLDEGLDIVDDRNSDPDAASRRVRSEYREKLAKRKAPHLYSDRLTLSGDPDAPLAGMSREQIDARLRELGVDPDRLGTG